MFAGIAPFFPTAEMVTSAGIRDGFVIYLCLKNTVSDTPFALVETTHRSQQPQFYTVLGEDFPLAWFFMDQYVDVDGDKWFGVVVMGP